MSTLTVFDEVTGKGRGEPILLEFLTDNITVRELIRQRVFQEVKDYNAGGSPVFRGLVQPTDSEEALNGYKVNRSRTLDWKPQFEEACQAFEATQVLVLVDDRQAESLDDEITITPQTEVTFLKLVPLVGG
jgi:hypothetical protein